MIAQEKDWQEIETYFLKPQLSKRNQIILIPFGSDREELNGNREMVVEISIRQNVR